MASSLPEKTLDSNRLVSVCAVVQNQGPGVADFLSDLEKVLLSHFKYYEIVLVDNGSRPETVALLKETLKNFRSVRYLLLSRRYDDQSVYVACLENAIGDFVVMMDPATDPPGLVPSLVQWACEGFDVVAAQHAAWTHRSWKDRLLTKLFYKISEILIDYKPTLNPSNYFCFSRRMVNSLLQIKDRTRYLKYLSTELGFSRKTIDYTPIPRGEAPPPKSFWYKFFFAMDLVVSNSEKLIRLANSLSLVTCLLSFSYFIYTILINIFKPHVAEGWTSTSIVMSVTFTVIFFVLFILGEYICLIYRESKHGPLYHVSEEIHHSSITEHIPGRNIV